MNDAGPVGDQAAELPRRGPLRPRAEDSRTAVLRVAMDRIVAAQLPHPFQRSLRADNALGTARHVLAMAIGLPYALAGSQRALMEDFVVRNEAPDRDIEMTTAFVDLLCWEHAGGHRLVQEHGAAGWRRLLGTQFQSSLLRADLERLFGQAVQPNFRITGPYLSELSDALSNEDGAWRCAALAAFDRHASILLAALWSYLGAGDPGLPEGDFTCFRLHARPEPIAHSNRHSMRDGLIASLSEGRQEVFLRAFERHFRRHIRWSEEVLDRGAT